MAQAFPRTPIATPAEQDRIATAWFTRQQQQWCVTALSVLIDLDPETAWSVIVRLVLEAPDEPALVNAAAGPLEQLLVNHGEAFVGRVEQLAKVSPEFQYALRNVWLPDDYSPAALRLEALGCQRVIAEDCGRELAS